MRRAEIAAAVVSVIEIPRVSGKDEPTNLPVSPFALGCSSAPSRTPGNDRGESAAKLAMSRAVVAFCRAAAGFSAFVGYERK